MSLKIQPQTHYQLFWMVNNVEMLDSLNDRIILESQFPWSLYNIGGCGYTKIDLSS